MADALVAEPDGRSGPLPIPIPHPQVQSAAARAVANLTQNIDNEGAIRAARAETVLFRLFNTGAADVKWQAKPVRP